MHNDNLADRMKLYEQIEDRRLIRLLPTIARIDGRCFHSFCKGLKRPYDERLSKLMSMTTKFLMTETGAKLGYTQSDEISLIWNSDSWDSQIYFDGRVQKIITSLAALASVYFNRLLPEILSEKNQKMPTFDARVWVVPNLTEAANYVLWREQDASRNSISMAAQSKFSHKQLQGKSGKEMQEMLFQIHGINWNDYPTFFKRGVYFVKKIVEKSFSVEEIEKLPALHEARKNPNLAIKRQIVEEVSFPPLSKISNRSDVLFRNELRSDFCL
jgi:tRNA(His) 5'-end guanylyltransferase